MSGKQSGTQTIAAARQDASARNFFPDLADPADRPIMR
jgi:hypothetical protein